MEVLDRFVLGKSADPTLSSDLCEDAVVVTGGFAAVIDGATDISGRTYDGVAGGRWAMTACVDAVHGFPPGLRVAEAVHALSTELAGRIDPDLPPAERPRRCAGR